MGEGEGKAGTPVSERRGGAEQEEEEEKAAGASLAAAEGSMERRDWLAMLVSRHRCQCEAGGSSEDAPLS